MSQNQYQEQRHKASLLFVKKRFYTLYNPDVRDGREGVSDKPTMLDRGGGVSKKSVFARMSLMDDPLPLFLLNVLFIYFFIYQYFLMTVGIYVSPCYYYPKRAGSPGRPSYIVSIDLKSGDKPSDHWVRRGTALLLSLDM